MQGHGIGAVRPRTWVNPSTDPVNGHCDIYETAAMAVRCVNVTPAWVQIGNETNSGVCKPTGSISRPAQMAGLSMAAHDMVKEVFPSTAGLLDPQVPGRASW